MHGTAVLVKDLDNDKDNKRFFSMNNIKRGVIAISVGLGLSLPSYAQQQCQNPTPIFEDNFDGVSLDLEKWEPMIGDGCSYGICGWGNNELQYYKAENATVADGMLTITAKKERVQSKKYTSARLRTAGMPASGEFTHGRFDARIKVPGGQGMWSAFWMLPTEPDVGWPMSGEIDIMEITGADSKNTLGTIHYGEAYPNNQHTGAKLRKEPNTWADDFHVYSVEWEPNELRWYVDDVHFSTLTPSDISNPAFWTFDQYAFHMLLNLAVGGNLGGPVDDNIFPQQMIVDYVRVYDYGQPAIQGDLSARAGTTEVYSAVGEQSDATYQWTVPQDATIISGQGTAQIEVKWGASSGSVELVVNDSCGTRNLAVRVHVAPAISFERALEDFEVNRSVSYSYSDGAFIQGAVNAQPDTLNSSSLVGDYTRLSTALYDVIAGSVSIPEAAAIEEGSKAFMMDILNNAPQGTTVLLQLEDSSTATPDNYPAGRHSKYAASLDGSNSWQRLEFELDERIDSATPASAVDSLVILFAPNTQTSDNYQWDNLAIYGSGVSNSAPVAEYAVVCDALNCSFDSSASSDSDGSITGYSWDFGDGNVSSLANPNHSFSAAATYSVTLNVTDDLGAQGSTTQEVTVSSGDLASSMSVASVTTATAGAGRGVKYAVANVEVRDNLGNPISGATVTGNFSGSIIESGVSAMTDTNGIATLQTSQSASGKLNVAFCVTDLSGDLTWDLQASAGSCQ